MGWILSGMMLLVLAGIVILNLFRGKKRGVVRTGISVCILIASAFVAIIASRKVSVVIAEAIVAAMRKSDDMQEVLHELPICVNPMICRRFCTSCRALRRSSRQP